MIKKLSYCSGRNRAGQPIERRRCSRRSSVSESLGALLSRVRLEQGKSQLRVAELLCAASGLATITRHEISRWEREERIPGGTWLRWLAVVLDTPLDELERAATVARERRETDVTGAAPPERPPRPAAGAGFDATSGGGGGSEGGSDAGHTAGAAASWPAERSARQAPHAAGSGGG